MSTAHAHAVALHGIDGTMALITATIGSTDAAIAGPHPPIDASEAMDRVRAAIRNSDLPWTREPVTVRSSVPQRRSSGMDLAMACALLAADGQIPADALDRVVLVGELALDGQVRPVRGLLPIVLAARRARHEVVIVPTSGVIEAGLVPGIRVLGMDRLADVVAWLRGTGQLVTPPSPGIPDAGGARAQDGAGLPQPDLANVRWQPDAVRALEVAAAGGHHLLLIGRPWAGKNMLARRLPGLLPPLTDEQALEVTAIHSTAGSLSEDSPLITTPPFIAPHHSTSVPALLGGGGGLAKPGALSLAHHGVLLLDDAPEFGPQRLEALRTTLEEGEIRLARRDGVVRYPARFQLVLAAYPCSCGPPRETACTCAPHARRRYLARLSGPLLDRIDLRVRLGTPPAGAAGPHQSDGTAAVRARVEQARQRAAQRWAPHRAQTNTDVTAAVFTRREYRLPRVVTASLDRALDTGAVTGRGALRTLRVAWTLADLAGLDRPGSDQVAEALDFRDRTPR